VDFGRDGSTRLTILMLSKSKSRVLRLVFRPVGKAPSPGGSEDNLVRFKKQACIRNDVLVFVSEGRSTLAAGGSHVLDLAQTSPGPSGPQSWIARVLVELGVSPHGSRPLPWVNCSKGSLRSARSGLWRFHNS
jgi:hypothetical protein